jgi:hypothetical protein
MREARIQVRGVNRFSAGYFKLLGLPSRFARRVRSDFLGRHMMLGRHGVHQVVVLCEYSIRIKWIPDRVAHFFEWVEWSLCQASHPNGLLRHQSAHLFQCG